MGSAGAMTKPGRASESRIADADGACALFVGRRPWQPVCCVRSVPGGFAQASRDALARGPSVAFVGSAGADRLIRRHEVLPAVADQVRAPHVAQRLAQQRPVVRVVIAQERLVQPAHAAGPSGS